jgi:RNase P/RNase MRP subunit POP5
VSGLPYTRHQVVRLIFSELSTLKRTRDRTTHIRLIDYNADKAWGILMCDHRSVESIRLLVNALNTKREGQPTLRIVGVSGTLKALKRKFLSKIR